MPKMFLRGSFEDFLRLKESLNLRLSESVKLIAVVAAAASDVVVLVVEIFLSSFSPIFF